MIYPAVGQKNKERTKGVGRLALAFLHIPQQKVNFHVVRKFTDGDAQLET